jgi:hypothetical protein
MKNGEMERRKDRETDIRRDKEMERWKTERQGDRETDR